MKEVKRGEIWIVSGGKNYMDGTGNGRTAIVVSDDSVHKNSDRCMVVFCTTKDYNRKGNEPVLIDDTMSYAICGEVCTVHKDRMYKMVGVATFGEMVGIDHQLVSCLGLNTKQETKQEKQQEDWKNKPLCIGCPEMKENKDLKEKVLKLNMEKSIYKKLYEELLMLVTGKKMGD